MKTDELDVLRTYGVSQSTISELCEHSTSVEELLKSSIETLLQLNISQSEVKELLLGLVMYKLDGQLREVEVEVDLPLPADHYGLYDVRKIHAKDLAKDKLNEILKDYGVHSAVRRGIKKREYFSVADLKFVTEDSLMRMYGVGKVTAARTLPIIKKIIKDSEGK